jgi:hypothetical protein
MKTQTKTAKRNVLMEPALVPVLKAQSEAMGCAGHKTQSISDILRRSAKTLMLKHQPNLRNLKEIDWTEVYTSACK